MPGPKSWEIAERHERFVARGLALGFPAFIQEAKGAMLTDMDSKIAEARLNADFWT